MALLKTAFFILCILIATLSSSVFIVDGAPQYMVNLTAPSGTRPYEMNITISNTTGTNTINASGAFVFTNGHSSSTLFNDTYFIDAVNRTNYSYTIINNTTGKAFINITQGTSITMFYGDSDDMVPNSNPNQTFIQWMGATSSSLNMSRNLTTPGAYIYEGRFRRTNALGEIWAGVTKVQYQAGTTYRGDAAYIKVDAPGVSNQGVTVNNDVSTEVPQTLFPINAYQDVRIIAVSATQTYMDPGYSAVTSHTLNLPNEAMGLFFNIDAVPGSTGDQLYSFIRHYDDTQPAFNTISTESEIDYLNIYTSDTLQYANTTENFSIVASYTTISTITIDKNYIGSFKVNFDMKVIADGTVFGKIYINNVAVGTEQSSISTTYATFSESFYGQTLLAGDVIQLKSRYTPGTSAGALNNLEMLFDHNYYLDTITLLTPTNGSTETMTFPPLTTNINFTWTDMAESEYNIMVAEDEAFNVIVKNTSVATNYSIQDLEAGTYWWRVRTHNTGMADGNWSDAFTFDIVETTTTTGSNINGIVYELINGAPVPINEATVYLYNSTLTRSTMTGSNGYFIFQGLGNNTTYQVYASKQGYDTTTVAAVSTYDNNTTTYNILMKIYISPYIPNFVFEKFTVKSLFDKPYPGVTANIYKGNELTVAFSGITDSMGQVVFQLIKDTYYRGEFSGSGLDSTITVYFYAKEEEYLITVWDGFPNTGDRAEDIIYSLNVNDINSTHSNLTFLYNDTRSSTTYLNFSVRNMTTNTSVCYSTSSNQVDNVSCAVVENGTYLMTLNATSSIYGIFSVSKVVNFNSGNVTKNLTPLSSMDSEILNWVCILIIIFLGSLFGATNVKLGAVIVPFAALVMKVLGTLQVSWILISVAVVLGIMAYIRLSERKVITT